MWTKICGTTNLEDAELAAALGADAVGFVFAASRRQVTPAEVAAITARLPAGVERVGVFDRPDVRLICRTVTEAGLSGVQLHFPLDIASLGELRTKLSAEVYLIQVIGVPADACESAGGRSEFALSLRQALARPELFAVLLDTVKEGQSGGTGEPFGWEAVSAVVREAVREAQERASQGGRKAPHLLLAGGLRAENVEAAIELLKPWGVDAVSGVEAEAGKKDEARLRHFLAATKRLSETDRKVLASAQRGLAELPS